jgi:hypothetical protein
MRSKRSESMSKLKMPTNVHGSEFKETVIHSHRRSNNKSKDISYDDIHKDSYCLNLRQKQTPKRTSTMYIKREKVEQCGNPYGSIKKEREIRSKAPQSDYTPNSSGYLKSRDSSATFTASTKPKKPPTVPKPFRLSSSNCRKPNVESLPSEPVVVAESKKYTFTAKTIPKSHRVPFMVMHSTKDLTQPAQPDLKTITRSNSRYRKGAVGKSSDGERVHDEVDVIKFKVNISDTNKVQISEIRNRKEPSNLESELSSENSSPDKRTIETKPDDMFNFDIDELLKQQESNLL